MVLGRVRSARPEGPTGGLEIVPVYDRKPESDKVIPYVAGRLGREWREKKRWGVRVCVCVFRMKKNANVCTLAPPP